MIAGISMFFITMYPKKLEAKLEHIQTKSKIIYCRQTRQNNKPFSNWQAKLGFPNGLALKILKFGNGKGHLENRDI